MEEEARVKDIRLPEGYHITHHEGLYSAYGPGGYKSFGGTYDKNQAKLWCINHAAARGPVKGE